MLRFSGTTHSAFGYKDQDVLKELMELVLYKRHMLAQHLMQLLFKELMDHFYACYLYTACTSLP